MRTARFGKEAEYKTSLVNELQGFLDDTGRVFDTADGVDLHDHLLAQGGIVVLQIDSLPVSAQQLIGSLSVERVIRSQNANNIHNSQLADRFALVTAGQTEARVTVAQGPDGALPTDCTIIGELVLGGLPPGPPTERIIVSYGLTSEGTLAIAATDTVSGKRTTDVRRDLTDLIKRMKQS